jgi:hypothetical protein
MKQIFRLIVFLAILCLLLGNTMPVLAGPPILPSSFYGTVKIGGANAPVGATVKAKINGVQYALTTVIAYGSDTVYSLDVPADDPGTVGVIEGGVEGDTVVFYVNNQSANETGTWHSGTNISHNLTVTAAPGSSISGDAGAGGVTLRFTDGTSKTATADSSGNYSFTVSYGWSGTVTPSKTGYAFSPNHRDYDNVVTDRSGQNYLALQTVSYKSVASYDGLVLESSENSNVGSSMNVAATTFNVGDDKANKQYRSILSFNTAPLPNNAVVTRITLKIKKAGLVGSANPFASLGNILVDVKKGNFSLPTLQFSDFQALPTASGAITIKNNPLTGGWYYGSLGGTANSLINRTGNTQFRLRFATDDNNNRVANYLIFYSGNAGTAGYRPMLVITFYVP